MKNPEEVLRACIITAWVEGRPCTQRHLAAAATLAGHEISQRQVGLWFEKWGKQGIAQTQIGSNGRPGAAYLFNWTGRSVEEVTLREIVLPVLLDAEGNQLQDEDSKKLRSALRTGLGIGERGGDDLLLEACARVSGRELHGVAESAYTAALEQVSNRTASNYRARIRRLLREAAEANRIPIVFERHWAEDGWTEARDRFFGSAVGSLTQQQRTLRCYWESFVRGIKALKEPPANLNEVTITMVDSVCDRYWETGRIALVSHIRSMLRRVGREFGEGPYAAEVQGESKEWTRNGWLNPGRLMLTGGVAASDGCWDTFLQMVHEVGYGSDWIDFLAWYGEFITLDFDDIEKQPDRFPTRPRRWQLKPTTRIKRIINLRTILYHAPRVLGIPPAELTPQVVFGTHHRRLMAELKTWWANRANSERLISSANSDGLEKLILSFGLVAYALCLRSQHTRRAAPSDQVSHRSNTQLGGSTTAAEADLLTAYRGSRTHAEEIEKARRRESKAHGTNTVRDLPRLIRNTPASFWVALLDEMLRQIQSHLLLNGDGVLELRRGISPYRFHSLVADAYYHGWLISTGMRISETGHVRLDIQYTELLRTRPLRECRLRAIDRKDTSNTLPHETAIRDRFVPAWLEDLYLTHSRPFFMIDWPREKERREMRHSWLFVDRKGRPYGCTEEDESGGGRNLVVFSSRLNHLRKRWQTRCAKVAVALGRRLPRMARESSNHGVRIAMGYQIRQEFGLTAAANYLGDQEGSIENVYAGVSGTLVDTTALAGQYEDWTPPTRQARADAEPKVRAAEGMSAGGDPLQRIVEKRMEDLVDRFVTGEVTQEEFEVQRRRLLSAGRC
jgi:hypothetical protein